MRPAFFSPCLANKKREGAQNVPPPDQSPSTIYFSKGKLYVLPGEPNSPPGPP